MLTTQRERDKGTWWHGGATTEVVEVRKGRGGLKGKGKEIRGRWGGVRGDSYGSCDIYLIDKSNK